MKNTNIIKEVVWREPEAAKRGKQKDTRLQQFERELRKNPNRWALASETPKRTTINPRFRGEEFERAYRTLGSGKNTKFRIYVRFVGKEA